eukprot:12908458-Prorocentrum_lima.AAC.1
MARTLPEPKRIVQLAPGTKTTPSQSSAVAAGPDVEKERRRSQSRSKMPRTMPEVQDADVTRPTPTA